MEQVAQRGCGIFIHDNIQNQCPKQPAFADNHEVYQPLLVLCHLQSYLKQGMD